MSTVTTPRPAPSQRPAAPRGRPPASGISAPPIDPFRVLRRHSLGITASVFVGLIVAVITFIACDWIYPLYTGEVFFEVQPGVAKPAELSSMDLAQDDAVTRLATTETILLVSRPVLSDAMKSREVLQTEWHKYYAEDGGAIAWDDAIDDLVEDLSATPVRNSNLFVLRWSTHVAADVPIVLNSIARAYIERRSTVDRKVYDSNLKVFEDQLTNTNNQIDDLSAQTRDFIREKGISSLEDPRFSQTALMVSGLVERIAAAQQNFSIIQSTLVMTAAKLEGTTAPTAEDFLRAEQNPVIMRLDGDILAVKGELARQRDKYAPGHSALIEWERRLMAMESTREEGLKTIMNRNLTAQLKELDDQRQTIIDLITSLEDEFEAKEKSLRDLAADSSTFLDMKKRADLLEEKRADDLDLIRQLQLMRLRADAARVRMAQECSTPREKSFPQAELIIPLVALLVVALTIAGVFVRELTDHRVKSASDLLVVPGARVLGVIPDLEDDPTMRGRAPGSPGGGPGGQSPDRQLTTDNLLMKHPQSVLAESYRQAASPISKAMAMAGHQSLLLVGGLPGAGTTTMATNLAAASAAAGKRVVLIDANFRRPRLAEALGSGQGSAVNQPGLGDLIVKAATIDQAVVKVEPGVDFIGPGTAASRVIERLHHEQLDSILAQLRSKYDLIIIDTPPAVVAGDALVLASKVDAAVLVVRAHQEQRGLVARLINQLADTHCDLLGILLNRARGTAGGYFKKNFATMAEYARSDAA